MAQLYPPMWIEDRPRRGSERHFYEACRSLPDTWIVIHDIAWIEDRGSHSHPYWQADFLILHPSYGLFLIGIKGGTLSVEHGIWYTTDYYGGKHKISRNPLDTDYDCIRTLHRKLKTMVPQLPLACGNILCVPSSEYPPSFRSVDVARELVIDSHDMLSLESSLLRGMQYWAIKEGFPSGSTPWFQQWIDLLIPILVPTSTWKQQLSTTIEHEKRAIVSLTKQQFDIWIHSFDDRRFGVRGCAGSGKTILAQLLAQRWGLLRTDSRVLLCCFNEPLATWLKSVNSHFRHSIHIRTIREIWNEMFGDLPLETPEIPSEGINILPRLEQYHAIIVDEAQDFYPTWWQALELRLEPEGRFAFFYDDNQRVYAQRTYPTDVPVRRLTVNLRTTKAIHHSILFYYRGSGSKPITFDSAPEGTYPIQFLWTTSLEEQTVLNERINLLLGEEMTYEDMAVLCAHKDQIQSIQSSLSHPWSRPGNKRGIVISTIRQFKGLERPIILVVGIHRTTLKTKFFDEMLYVAFSRAQNRVILFIHNELYDRILFPTSPTDLPPPKAELSESLTSEQRKAMEAPLGVAIVRAGAGSGKTRVLSHRIAYLCDVHCIPPTAIVAVTFTKKAADELRRRTNNLLTNYDTTATVSTFHGLAFDILRKGIHHTPDGKLNQRTAFFNMHTDDTTLVKGLMGTILAGEAKACAQWISYQKSQNSLDWQDPSVLPTLSGEEREYFRIWGKYERYMQIHNLMDFNDLILEAINLLERFPEIRSFFQRQWHHFLIDEFQDTNPPQFKLLRLLYETDSEDSARSLMVVGDSQQAIYGWRGADYSIFRDLTTVYTEAQEYVLSINYRSDPPVLDMANAITREDLLGVPPLYLIPDRTNKNVLIRVIENSDVNKEAEEIIDLIRYAHDRLSVKWSEIAILMRAPRSEGEFLTVTTLQNLCVAKQVPCRAYGITPFHRHPMIIALTNFLAALAHPEDDYLLEKWFISPYFKNLGASYITKIKKHISLNETLWSFLINPPNPILDIRTQIADRLKPIKGIGDATTEYIAEGVELITLFMDKRHILQSGQPEAVYNLLLEITVRLDITNRVKLEKDYEIEDFESGTGAVSTWRHFMCDMLVEHRDPLYAAQMIFFQGQDRHSNEQHHDQDAIQITSIHASKGREYDMVIVVGFEEGVFPSFRAETTEQQFEEARLCYVALTRARHHLILSRILTHRIRNILHNDDENNEEEELPGSRFLPFLIDPFYEIQHQQSQHPGFYSVTRVEIYFHSQKENLIDLIEDRLQEKPGTVPVRITGMIQDRFIVKHTVSIESMTQKATHRWLSSPDWNIWCEVDMSCSPDKEE